MKKTIIAAALLAATTIPVEALAVSSANGNGTCGNGQTTCGSTPTTPTTPTTPAVTSPSVNVGPVASTSSSGAAALSNSDSAALAFNAVDNTNRNVNRNANALENTNNVGPLTNTLDNAVNVSASNQNTAFGGDGGSAYVGPVSSTNENNATGGTAYSSTGPVSSTNSNANNATGGTALATTGPVTSTNVNSIDAKGGTASATTGPVTSNTASNSNQSQSTANANNSSVNVEGDQYRAAASTAYAPQLVAGSDTCMGSSSAGGQGIGFGFSLGTSWTDKNCVRLKQTRQLQSMGEGAAARELMCQDVDVWMAFAAAGTPCLSPKPARGRK
jgi:hypothetical protein